MSDGYIERFAQRMARTSGTAAPTSGTWGVGDLRWNNSLGAGQPVAWVCIAAGTPGTWAPISIAQANATTVVSAAGTVSPADNVVTITTGAFNVTLAAPTASQYGAVISFMNNAAGAITLTPVSGVTLYAGSAVVSSNSQAQVKVVGGNYYRIA